MKDFDSWGKEKKNLEEYGENKFYHPRDIWWCSLGLNIGFEQDGTGKDYDRPVLVLKGFSKNVCLIVPLTTSTKKNPYHVSAGIVDGKDSFAIISQIRLVDTKRLTNKLAVLEVERFDLIKKAIKDFL